MLVGAQLNVNHHNSHLRISYNKITGYITKELIDEYNELYQLNKENKLENNTVVNLTPLSNFPSYKLKNYIEENNLNITTARKLDKLDYLIINNEFIHTSYLNLKLKPYHIVPSEVILENSLFKPYIKEEEDWYQIKKIQGNNITHYFIDEENYKKLFILDKEFSIIKNYPLINCGLIENSWGDKKACDNINYFVNLYNTVNKYNLKIIFDNNINDEINQGLSIDDDIFENILTMISSDDEGNLQIAKEILANMDFELSKPYLIYLFNYFYQLKASHNNKNYEYLKKHLKKYLYLSPTKNDPSIFDRFLPRIINKHPEYYKEFMNCFRIHMNILCKKEIIKEIITH